MKMIDLQKLCTFLVSMNSQSEKHIGYCRVSKSEIFHTLTEGFSDLPLKESFYIHSNQGHIIGAFGFDVDMENRSAEVWGPFTKDNEIASVIWDEAFPEMKKYVDTFSFFVNLENINAIDFMDKIGAKKQGGHITYIVSRHQEKLESIDSSFQEYTPIYMESFIQLHEETFPNSYYNGEQIIRQLNIHKRLFLWIKDHKVISYVYMEADPLHHEGSIEFVSVCPTYRARGIGKKITTFAINQLFLDDRIHTITICVGDRNENAIGLYQSLGFKVKHQLIHYTLR